MGKDETSKATGIEPEAAFRRIQATEEADAEGHGFKHPLTEDAGVGPEGMLRWGGKATEDAEDDTQGNVLRVGRPGPGEG